MEQDRFPHRPASPPAAPRHRARKTQGWSSAGATESSTPSLTLPWAVPAIAGHGTFPEVRVDAHVSRRPRQALVLSVGDVFFGLGVNVLLGQAKVNDVDGVLTLAARPPHQEVLWLDISVDQAFGVNVLHSRDLWGEGLASAGSHGRACSAGMDNAWPFTPDLLGPVLFSPHLKPR